MERQIAEYTRGISENLRIIISHAPLDLTD